MNKSSPGVSSCDGSHAFGVFITGDESEDIQIYNVYFSAGAPMDTETKHHKIPGIHGKQNHQGNSV